VIRHLPNLITAIRLMLVGPFIWGLLQGRFEMALWLILFMGFSDGLDGFLAKRFGWQTVLGAYLDPIADKTMLVSAYAALGWLGLVPVWLVILIILRDLIILAGAAFYQVLTHHLIMRPSYLSKLNTGAQIILVLVVLLDQLAPLPGWLLSALIFITLLTTVVSGVDYVWDWTRRARQHLADRPHSAGGEE